MQGSVGDSRREGGPGKIVNREEHADVGQAKLTFLIG